MTPSEFKAWFDGFTEAFTGCPTKAQWTRIKARVSEIDGKPVTERVYVDRYWPSSIPFNGYPYRSWLETSGGMASSQCGNSTVAQLQYANALSNRSNPLEAGHSNSPYFNSMQAMADLGRAEASTLDS
jgi:hypothetical protein